MQTVKDYGVQNGFVKANKYTMESKKQYNVFVKANKYTMGSKKQLSGRI